MKKIFFGFIWFLVFYISLYILLGIVVYLASGVEYPSFQEGFDEGFMMGGKFAESGGDLLFILISVALSSVLSFKGILPGTQKNKLISDE